MDYLKRKLKESRSLEVRQSKVPQTLSRLQDDILLDDWSELEAVDDQEVLIEGIFDFLKIFRDLYEDKESRDNYLKQLSY